MGKENFVQIVCKTVFNALLLSGLFKKKKKKN